MTSCYAKLIRLRLSHVSGGIWRITDRLLSTLLLLPFAALKLIPESSRRTPEPTDAVFGFAYESHDAMLRNFESRFSLQSVTTLELLEVWKT